MIFIKPVTGVELKMDNDQIVPESGGYVPDTKYWHRRVLFGSAILCNPEATENVVSSNTDISTESNTEISTEEEK